MANGLLETLLDISRFDPSGASRDLLDQASEVAHQINSRRPLSDAALQRLQKDILYDRVHSSAVTEGNRLSRRETIVVLSAGIVEAGARKDELEVRNLAEAILELEQMMSESLPLMPQSLRNLHSLLLRDIAKDQAGKYRSENVAISGAKVTPPSFHDVPDMVRHVLLASDILESDRHPIQKAAWLHWALARIHPFKDGNGRIARLAQDYVLLMGKLVPAPLRPEDREGQYYAALESADLGDGKMFLELVAKNTLRTADKYLAIINEEATRRDWIAKITRAATEKVRETEHRQFLRMQRAANLVKSEFFSIVNEISDRVPGFTIAFKDYGTLSFEQYQDLCAHGRAKRSWFFGLEFRILETILRYIFWFGAHQVRPEDMTTDFPEEVVILVSTEEEYHYYRLLDEIQEDRVTLRELIPDGSEFWRRRHNPVENRSEWDTGVSSSQVARDFMQEVFGKLGLL